MIEIRVRIGEASPGVTRRVVNYEVNGARQDPIELPASARSATVKVEDGDMINHLHVTDGRPVENTDWILSQPREVGALRNFRVIGAELPPTAPSVVLDSIRDVTPPPTPAPTPVAEAVADEPPTPVAKLDAGSETSSPTPSDQDQAIVQ